ncbi:2OG-Fe(II) oxygenase [Pontibacter fetidus]|uniref:2OG-Fe(II) oxygenase n=1 Tax=Pontibacter fetidus TaxID=2700082 RepID=A0A6B2H5R8_9BACT|nr:2OG-Fe(II) oxygenase [Pontibacter fetidus]NDK54482.1 2OG-Fe(II) oxygenase [Pontibacter fetidus]
MQFINLNSLQDRLIVLRNSYQEQKPFRFVVIDDFLQHDAAEQLYKFYPPIAVGNWDSTTYIDQKNKYQKTKFEQDDIFSQVFGELNSGMFLNWLQQLTGIAEPLVADDSLFGGGLHQSTNGAFLNVHVDYNVHPVKNYHRRLNVLVYLNKEWKAEFEGRLELWDLTEGKSIQIANIAPTFNRCVIFETNEISYHGHPRKLNVPAGITRKSLATYYYTATRPQTETAPAHNTIFVNTEGLAGQVKRLQSGLKAALERINKR